MRERQVETVRTGRGYYGRLAHESVRITKLYPRELDAERAAHRWLGASLGNDSAEYVRVTDPDGLEGRIVVWSSRMGPKPILF